MPKVDSVTQSIVAYNRGRDPQRLRRKFELLRRDPFAFFRGTCHLYYATLPRDVTLDNAPAVLACGDLHLENFGTYKGDNRLVYFDLNDFDEAALAPCTFELARFATSVHIAAAHFKLTPPQAAKLSRTFIDTYRAAIADGKPRWIERTTADGMVKDLLHALEQRKRVRMLDQRTTRGKAGRRLRIDGEHALAMAPAGRRRIVALLKRFAATDPEPEFYRVLDVARRVAGNGSLGVERYVLLVEGRGSPDDNYLLDLKLAAPSAMAPATRLRQPKWASEAARVVAVQRIVQAISPARLTTITDGARSYVLKELQPADDRLDLTHAHGHAGRLESVMASMAEVTAWGHLRGCSRFGAAGVEVLQCYIGAAAWKKHLFAAGLAACKRTLAQWHAYCVAYDRGNFNIGAPDPGRPSAPRKTVESRQARPRRRKSAQHPAKLKPSVIYSRATARGPRASSARIPSSSASCRGSNRLSICGSGVPTAACRRTKSSTCCPASCSCIATSPMSSCIRILTACR